MEKKLNLIVLATALFFATCLNAQQKEMENYFNENIEAYFKFDVAEDQKSPELAKMISIDKVEGNTVWAYANKAEMKQFMQKDIEFEMLTHPGKLIANPNMKNKVNIREIETWDFYPTYEAYVDMMYQFASDYPDICEIVEIGESIQGRKLLFARISDNVGVDEGETQAMYTSTMHGDETAGYILALRLIDYFLINYGNSDRITNMVNTLDIWINPLANPDGTFAGGNNTVYGSTRANANGIDLNRNFPDPEDGPHPDGNAWQIENIAMMDLAQEQDFALSSNWHGGAEVCNYPWDTWQRLHPDTDWWEFVCREYADTAHLYSPTGYMDDLDNGITNGYAWYTTSGSRQDYMNYFHQCREFTLEISNTKVLPEAELENHWEYNYRSLLNYIEQAAYGFEGIVTSAITGEPIVAEVFVVDHDLVQDSSWVYSSLPYGYYKRMIYEGTYTIRYSAPGYITKNIQANINKYQTKTIDVALNPDLQVDFEVNNDYLLTGSSVNFMDISNGDPYSWEWTFEGASPATSNEQNPQNISYETAGVYAVTLTASNEYHTFTVTKEAYITVGAPFADFQAEPLVANVGEEIQFTDLSSQNPTEWHWTFGDWETSQEQNPIHAYQNAGTYTVSLKASNEYGEQIKVRQAYITINAAPEADFEASQQIIATGNSIDFSDLSAGQPTSWLWAFEGGEPASSTEQNPQGILYAGSGTFNVELTVTNEFGTNTILKEGYITAGEAPVAQFSADVTEIVAGESIVFSDESTGNPDAWAWYLEGGTPEFSDMQVPEAVFYNEAGTFEVTLKVSNMFGSDSLTMNDYVHVGGVGIEKQSRNDLGIHPNPAVNYILISGIDRGMKWELIRIFSQNGTEVLNITNPKVQKIDVSALAPGLYTLELISGHKRLSSLFIKK